MENVSLDKPGPRHSEPSGLFVILRGEEFSKSVLVVNARREAGLD